MLEPLFLKITKRGVSIVSNGVTKFAFMNSLLPCISPKNAFTLGTWFYITGSIWLALYAKKCKFYWVH